MEDPKVERIKRIVSILEKGRAFDCRLSVVKSGGTRIAIQKTHKKDFRFHVMIDYTQCIEFEGRGVPLEKIVFSLVAHELDHARIVLEVKRRGEQENYSKKDHELLNIAEDFEINWRISMDKSIGIHADQYGYEPFMKWDYYYDVLEKEIQESGNFDDFIVHNMLSGKYGDAEDLRKDIEKLSDQEKESLEQKLQEIRKAMGTGPGDVQRDSEFYKKEFDISFLPKNTATMIRDIRRMSNNISMENTPEELTFFRFSNRRPRTDIVQPGIQEITDKYNKNIDKTTTVFIDMSGSMEKISDTIVNIIKYTHNRKIRTVLYNHGITRIIEPQQKLPDIEIPSGGNDLEKAYEEYKQDHKELENIVVITDGGEPCLFDNPFSAHKDSFVPGVFFEDHPKAVAFIVSDDRDIMKVTKSGYVKL